MKTLTRMLRLPVALATFAALFAVAPAAEAKREATPADLQVIVDVPPTWRPFLDDDIAEALFYRLKEVFKRRGYKGEIVQLTSLDKEAPDAPVLRLNLTEWRVDRVGNAQCTMTATLKTGAGESSLGLATGTAILWAHGSRWSFSRQLETADALEGAADNALREVYDAAAKSGRIRGLEARR